MKKKEKSMNNLQRESWQFNKQEKQKPIKYENIYTYLEVPGVLGDLEAPVVLEGSVALVVPVGSVVPVVLVVVRVGGVDRVLQQPAAALIGSYLAVVVAKQIYFKGL